MNPADAERLGTVATEWGAYGQAIRRWEMLTRPAPVPLTDGRLSPAFVEWMMGFPSGWVTEHVARAAALRLLGNAVVPPQAALAVRLLIGSTLEVAAS